MHIYLRLQLYYCRWGKMIKPEKVTKLSQSDGAATAFKKFCDSDDRCVFVYETDGDLTVSSRPAPAAKMGKKMLAFSKDDEHSGIPLEV